MPCQTRPTTTVAIMTGKKSTTWEKVRPRLATNNSDPAPRPIAIGMVRKISVHLILLKNAEKKTGSAKMVRKLSKPTKDGAVAPSQSQKAIAIVSSPGIKMIAALIISAGSKNGTAELENRTANGHEWVENVIRR